MITTKVLVQIQAKMANEANKVLNPRPNKIFRAIIEEETVAEFENFTKNRFLGFDRAASESNNDNS